MGYPIEKIHSILSAEGQIVRPDCEISHLLTDSRQIVFGDKALFFAISGPHFDGHRFLDQAYQEGVRNFVVEKIPDQQQPDANYLLVSNTVNALQQLAAYHRAQYSIPVIGITGSNGKTIVKEWIYHLLKIPFDIVRSPKSYNSQIGVPLSVWGMDEKNELAIFEAGISLPGEMEKLEPIIHPTLGVMTNITDTHSEGFASNEEKVNQKMQLFAHSDRIIYRKDAEIIRQHIPPLKTVIDWSIYDEDAAIQIKDVEILREETLFSLKRKASIFHFTIPFIDKASFENAVHALVASIEVLSEKELLTDKNIEVLTEQASTLPVISMRMEIKKGINNCLIINDSYSGDLDALEIALQFQKQQSGGLNKTIILSDFDDSSLADAALYQQIAALLKENNITRLIGVGKKIQAHVEIFSPIHAICFSHVEAALTSLSSLPFSNEIILIKGARRFQLERIGQLLELKSHGTVLNIFLHNMVHNLNVYRAQLSPEVKVMAMVKAYSYGSGQAEIARTLAHQRIDYLAVAYADEGVDLRKQGIKLPIMVMNPEPDTFEQLFRFDLEPELYSISILEQFIQFQSNLLIPGMVRVHIKFDTGMHRLGFEEQDLNQLIKQLQQNPGLQVASIFSHLAAADDALHDGFTQQQISLFKKLSDRLISGIGYPVMRHLVNSPGIAKFHDAQFDMVRLGIGLYGIDPSDSIQQQLLPVSELLTTISQIREIKKGESVGYSRSFIADHDMRIATINIGYADGFSRRMSNGAGKVFINGSLAPVIGRVCMDMTMVDISHIPLVKDGDSAELFGEHISIQEYAERQNTIPYEVMTGISQRVKRVYLSE